MQRDFIGKAISFRQPLQAPTSLTLAALAAAAAGSDFGPALAGPRVETAGAKIAFLIHAVALAFAAWASRTRS